MFIGDSLEGGGSVLKDRMLVGGGLGRVEGVL